MAKQANSNTNSRDVPQGTFTKHVLRVRQHTQTHSEVAETIDYDNNHDHLMRDSQERCLHPGKILWK